MGEVCCAKFAARSLLREVWRAKFGARSLASELLRPKFCARSFTREILVLEVLRAKFWCAKFCAKYPRNFVRGKLPVTKFHRNLNASFPDFSSNLCAKFPSRFHQAVLRSFFNPRKFKADFRRPGPFAVFLSSVSSFWLHLHDDPASDLPTPSPDPPSTLYLLNWPDPRKLDKVCRSAQNYNTEKV